MTGDIEIRNDRTVTRGEVGGHNGVGGRGRVFRNNYKGHMDKTKGVGIRGGSWGWLGLGESGTGNGDNCT